MSNSTSLPQPPLSEPVKGVSIFWPLFTLALASALHPLGSACGEKPARYRYYMRALPLSGLLDSLYFLSRCRDEGSTTCILAQLDENNPNLIQPYLPSDEAGNEPINGFLDFFVDFKARIFPGVFILLAYVKLCTFSGVPGTIALGSIFLLSWGILEGVLIIQHFRRSEVKMATLRRAASWPLHETGLLSLEAVRFLNRLLLVFQIFAFLCLGVIIVVRHSQQRGHHSSARSTIHFTTVLQWLLFPTTWAWRWGWIAINAAEHKSLTLSGLLQFLSIYFVVLPVYVISSLFVVSILFIHFASVVLVVRYTPQMLYMLYHYVSTLQWVSEVVGQRLVILRCAQIFSFVFFGSMIAYYAVLYSSNGVSKRTWSDVLG